VSDPRSLSPVAPAWHTTVLLAFLAFLTWLSASSAPGAEGPLPAVSRPAIYATVLAFQWLLFALAFWGLRLGGVSVRSLVAYRWSGWGGVARCLLIAAMGWAAIFLGIAQGLDWIGLRDPEEMKRVAEMLLPRGPLEFAIWTLVALTAGFVEEVVFRGYLQRQLSAWCRNHVAGIALSALLFGVGHLYQGIASAGLIAAIGLCFSLLAYATRSLAPGILAHAAEDFVAGVVGHA
jgi:membrane protease YdiL (CAAX protease family)